MKIGKIFITLAVYTILISLVFTNVACSIGNPLVILGNSLENMTWITIGKSSSSQSTQQPGRLEVQSLMEWAQSEL